MVRLDTALQGLEDARGKLERTAERVAKSGLPDASTPPSNDDVDLSAEAVSLMEARNQLLIASHRAMLSAIGEMGGTRAWLRFFANHQNLLTNLDEIGALPENVTPIQQAQTDTVDRSDPSPPSKPAAMTDERQRAD